MASEVSRLFDQVNFEIEKRLDNTKVDMIITNRINSLSGGVTLSSIGPEFMISVMSSGAHSPTWTTKGRVSYFRLENPYVGRPLTRLKARDRELAALQSRRRKLRETLKQSIEILEDSHGKGIRVFTVMAVLSLPL
ncbi:hypothetical protein F4775DRAFT_588299 [Biscogniauxia sp. FL1348]|nr:hypothetical protein F4775DRAFT_588299 [Biscogniauxia sp. FL1348]